MACLWGDQIDAIEMGVVVKLVADSNILPFVFLSK